MSLNCPPGGSIEVRDMISEMNVMDNRITHLEDVQGVVRKNLWNFYYYADEEIDRVVGINPDTMQEENTIALAYTSSNAGSADRAGYTDKMYVRTAGYDHIEVLDLVAGKSKGIIPLIHHPRSSGGYNRYRELQVISTKVEPYAQVIDVNTDRVVLTVGSDHTTEEMGGNDGGNATGHSGWLDADHFYLMDRYRNSIFVYKINENYPPYTTTLTDTFVTNTSAHSLNPAEPRHLLETRTFYIAVEGSVSSKDDVPPEVLKVTFDSSTGKLTQEAALSLPGSTSNSRLHHFGINPAGNTMGIPVSDITNNGNNITYIVNLDTFTISSQHNVGLGAGHCNFSDKLNVCCVTNHYDQFTSLINLNDNSVVNINISEESISWGKYIQSHRNWVSGDGRYFYLFNTYSGIFLEIDIAGKGIRRRTVTGGKPIQSTS